MPHISVLSESQTVTCSLRPPPLPKLSGASLHNGEALLQFLNSLLWTREEPFQNGAENKCFFFSFVTRKKNNLNMRFMKNKKMDTLLIHESLYKKKCGTEKWRKEHKWDSEIRFAVLVSMCHFLRGADFPPHTVAGAYQANHRLDGDCSLYHRLNRART